MSATIIAHIEQLTFGLLHRRQNWAVVGRMHFKTSLHLYGKKTNKKKKKLRLIFDHKIAMLHPIYT